MHEWAIAENLVQQLVDAGRREHLEKISRVSIRVGVLRQVVNETLKESFEIQAEGTIAGGAKLEIQTVPLSFKCGSCGTESVSRKEFFLTCPKCSGREVEIMSGKELYIEYIEGEREEDSDQ